MPGLRMIEIDFDIHQKIEAERRSFNETPNTVLRRLLKMPPAKATNSPTAPETQPWEGEGVSLPHETVARMEYNGKSYEALITNGKWLVHGEAHDSPSGAASVIATTKSGRTTKLNGWNYWKVQMTGNSAWIPLTALRRHGRAA